ncbi:TerB N-terminal domain-containing protein [Shewanella xiamenensis]|uniref:TerB N-terminal domain-containing protein n=1 Tax=Shewanella xiamenensis TaxID=332186 RepID=A0ABT6UJF7_9GAMM|nr:TerB N-terminal domain-containing protein [Shewanella xiamenensis]MDH1315023.1 TerB N-terminal domain-containing protein [Shewanella xiamenensis]MDI5833429.1 TerB N-terminal domain-containing protein [Shewanella xiamenensis]
MADLLIFGLLVGAVYLVLKKFFSTERAKSEKELSRGELKPTLNRMSESASSLYSNHSASNATSSNRTQFTVKSQSNVETLKDDEFLEVVIPTTGVEVIDLKELNPKTADFSQMESNSDGRQVSTKAIAKNRILGASAEKPLKEKFIWLKSEDSVNVKGITVRGGFFYFGHDLKSLDGYGAESSLVAPSLPIMDVPMTYEDESLGYWPSYSSISPGCRGAYLKWLSSDRSNPNVPLGYVFIYLYGLERRVVVDNPESDIKGKVSSYDLPELCLIFDEVKRLRSIYGSSNSFYRYSTRLLELISIFALAQGKELELEIEDSVNSHLFRFKVALEVGKERPLPSSLAFDWINNHPEYRLKTPARRCFDLFKLLFVIKYQQQFGEGLKISPNKTTLKIIPHLSSGSLRAVQSLKFDLPDAGILTGPFKKFIAIAESCNQELEAYSRYLAKVGTSSDDIVGLLMLPDQLFAQLKLDSLTRFKAWLAEQSTQQPNIQINALWLQLGLEAPTKFNKNETDFLTRLMDKIGFGFAPDPRFHHSKLQADGLISVYPIENPELKLQNASKAFDELLLLLKLGAIISCADGHASDDEKEYLLQLLRKDPVITGAERKSLEAFVHWQLATPPSLSLVKAKLDTIKQSEKAGICNILASLVLADGKVESKEIKQLEGIYTALGLDKTSVSSDIHRVATAKPSGAAQSTDASKVRLDDAILKIHENETKDVQAMLHAIFTDDEPETASIDVAESEGAEKDVADVEASHTLAKQYQPLLQAILQQHEWSRKDFKLLCDANNLMVNDVVEVINDWAYDVVGAPLIEEDYDFKVDAEIAEEINELGK